MTTLHFSPKRWLYGLSLQVKFTIGMTVILFGLSALLSFGLYKELEALLIRTVYEKSQLVMAELEATRSYVRDVLRPKVSSIVPEDEFIIEAMSSSYVSRKIMERFQLAHPDFTYKRVAASANPRNPANLATPFERELILRFGKNRNLQDWQGIVTHRNSRFFVMMTPILMEDRCLRCHGTPQDAPARLIERYGDRGGFNRKPGSIAGLESVSFPVESAMARIKEQAIALLATGLLATLVILSLTTLFFRSLVASRFGSIKRFFREFVSDGKFSRRIEVKNRDEIADVCHAFNSMADQLQSLMQQRDKLLAEANSQREKLRSVFDAITDRLLLMTPDYSVLTANPAALGDSGASTDSLKCYEMLYGLSEPCKGCQLARTVSEKVPSFGEIELPGGDILLSQLYPIIDPQTGQVGSVVHYCRSITEKKLMERHMMQAEKLASLGQLVAGVAHELNNPLGIVLFYAGLLEKELPTGSRAREDVQIIEKHSETCKSIVDDLLKFARNVETRATLSDVNASIEQVMDVLARQFGKERVRMKKNLAPGLPPIPIDETKMQQVWMNLLLNAKQATEQGCITVSTSRDPMSGRVGVVIEDTGYGIPPEIIHKIFDPFYTTKKTGEGTGLGLSVSYGIVKEHGGEILVRSVPGKGSVFEVWLPEKEPE
ncbi:MAG: DUF3365 domain-containing protein [Thermodesulfobacteriota bacterium]